MINFLSEANGFQWSSLIPIAIMLIIACLIPVILSLCHIKFIPVLVIEIIAGLTIASIPELRNFFIEENNILRLNLTSESMYMIGTALLLFISGLETDYSVIYPAYKGKQKILSPLRISWIFFGIVVILSILGSMIFRKYYVDNVKGFIVMVIILSSTFASLVIPVVRDAGYCKTTIGQIIDTYATIAEFISILGLSIVMLIGETRPWILFAIIGILLGTYIVQRFVPSKIFKKAMGGIVHLGMRLIMVVVLVLVMLADYAGAEFVLGAFLAGMVIKAAKIKEEAHEKIEAIGYGIFVPMFYILVGVKVGLTMPYKELFTGDNLLLIGSLFVALVVVKLPFMALTKWYSLKTTISTMFIVTSTIIVAITAEHLGVFEERFCDCLIVASVITCIIPPIFFALHKTYGVSRPKYNEIIIDPDEVENE